MDAKFDTSILHLDMYVLDRIFHKIYWLRDRISLAITHPYLGEAFAFHSRSKFKDVAIQSYSREQLRLILEYCGTTVISLRDKTDCQRRGDKTSEMMELAGKYCPNLENLTVRVSAANVKTVENNLIKLKRLYAIHVEGDRTAELKHNAENLMKILAELPNLRKLELDLLTWDVDVLLPMNDSPKLDILKCNYLQDAETKLIGNVWKNLKTLTSVINRKTLIELSKCCISLENLELWGYSDHEKKGFGHFPSLKRLQLISLDCANGHGLRFKYLHGNYNNQLESLILPCGYISTANEARRLAKLQALKTLACLEMEPRCIRYIARMPLEKLTLFKIAKTDLLLLLRECKTLRWLHLDESGSFDRDFVLQLLEVLGANVGEPRNPFELNLHYWRSGLKDKIPEEVTKSKILDIKMVYYHFQKRY